MFLNNPASTRSILTNNENAPSFHRSKSLSENGSKKTTFNENATKTPHRNNKDAGGTSKGGGQTTQRRRRALGDISNRKAGGGKGGASGGKGSKGGGIILKQGSGSLKPSMNTKSNRTAQVKFSKTPSTKSTSTNKTRLGGGGNGLKSTNSKPKQRTSTEYDGVFGVTTRWADDILEEDTRSPLDLIPKEEMNMLDDFQNEVHGRQKKEEDERDRLEQERCDNAIDEMINDTDIDGLGELFDSSCDVAEKKQFTDEWDLLDQKLPWEEEDGDFDPAEERRLSGSDPYSLWGDI